jgi:hypothetical protein
MGSQGKTLAQMLFEFAGQPKANNAARNYKVFMEHWDEIQAEHGKGWSYLMIWRALQAEGIFTFSYPAFTSYIRKVKNRRDKAATGKRPSESSRGEAVRDNAIPPARLDKESRRF